MAYGMQVRWTKCCSCPALSRRLSGRRAQTCQACGYREAMVDVSPCAGTLREPIVQCALVEAVYLQYCFLSTGLACGAGLRCSCMQRECPRAKHGKVMHEAIQRS